MTHVTRLAAAWNEAGVEPGKLLLVHSSIRRTVRSLAPDLQPRQAVEVVIDSLLHAVGEGGTVLFPLFNFEAFPKHGEFDMRTTPSQMGALTEAARNRPDAVRTGHPIYSFAVLGYQAESFKNVNNFSGYGIDSPFGDLLFSEGQIAVIDLDDQNSQTFYHFVEEAYEVPYRWHKVFAGVYTDMDGVSGLERYGLFVRQDGVRTDVNPMGERLWDLGLYSGERPKEGFGMRVIDARPMFDAVGEVIESGHAEGMLYTHD